MSEKKTTTAQATVDDGEGIFADPRTPAPLVRMADEEQQQHAELERTLLTRLQAVENATKIIERRSDLLRLLRVASIKDTDPQTWVAHRDREGRILCIPNEKACARIRKVWGIRIFNMRPVDDDGNFSPEIIEHDSGAREYRGWADGVSNVTGEMIESVEFSRRSDEEFIGRIDYETKEPIGEGDIRSAVASLGRAKLTRILTGLGNVASQELEAAWQGHAWKKFDQVTKGHGFGSSTERGAQRVASEDVKDAATSLGEEIMRRVGGDQEAASKLLKEITANPPKFGGFTTIARLTQDWQIENAWKKLKAHEIFGDNAMSQGGDD